MTGWLLVGVVAAQTFALRLVGTSSAEWMRRSPTGLRVVEYVAPAVLGGLVALATFGSEGELVLDARAAGVAAAAIAVLLRAPILVVVGLAVGVTAGLRALG